MSRDCEPVRLRTRQDDGRTMIVAEFRDGGELAGIEGRTFQVHRVNDGVLELVPIGLVRPDIDLRCPVIVSGERCCFKAGHGGKHMWGSGD